MFIALLAAVALAQGQTFVIDTPPGARLEAAFVDAGRGAPGVLFFPMCSEGAMTGWMPVAERLRTAGVSSLIAAPRGNQRELDADAAFAELRKRIGSDTPIAVAGSSCGVWFAMTTAVRHADVRAVIAFTGPHTTAQLEHVRKTPGLAVFSGAAELDMPAPDWARALKDASASPASRIELVPGKAHGTDNLAANTVLAQRIAEWLTTQLSASVPATQAAQPQSPCESPSYRAFDFWVGDWNVVNAAGRPAGTSHVERLLAGCVIMEHWTGANGPYAGKSFNTFNPADGKWTQHWVDSAGASILMTGAFENGRLVYQREFVRRDGAAVKSRMTFVNLEPGKVRQLVEQSTDGGQTWTPQIDLTYTKRG